MRFFILISLLCSIAFSAPVLNGAEATQTITINSSSVAETNGHFLYQLKIPRTGLVATTVDSANDVAITRVNDTTRHPRWVVFTTDTIYLYADLAVSSTVDTSYRLQYGKSLNEVNSSSTFTNCGIASYVGLNESSGTSTTDYANSTVGTLTGSATREKVIFDGGISNPALSTSSYVVSAGGWTSNRSNVSVSFVVSVVDRGSLCVLFSDREASTRAIQVNMSGATLYVYTAGTGTSNNYGEIWPSPLKNNTKALITVVFNGSGATNADRLKLYYNNTQVNFSEFGSGGIPPTTANLSGANMFLNGWTNLSNRGELDEPCIYTSSISAGNVVDRYNMLFNPSAFSTLGTPLAIDVSAEMGIDTLTFTCSAENALTYQWYLDGAEMVGETDSVLVIYADSAFYSTAHTLYCLVNGSVISDSWVITTEFSAEMGIDTLRLVCSAENALTYQWYDNNVPVTGATDSVYTIYAGSTFYSIKHVIYCLVNGSVRSGEWKFQATISRTSRWDSYKMFYKQAYKNTWK